MGRQRHRPAAPLAAVAVGERYGVVVAGGDGLVGKGGAVDVAAEIVEHDGGARDGLGEDDPALAPRHVQRDARQRRARPRHKPTAEVLRQRAHRDEKGLIAMLGREPRAAVRCECARGHQHVDMRMPLERARPGVQRGERADATAEPARVRAQRGERFERGDEEHAEQRALMAPHDASQLRWQREHHVEVRDGKQQRLLMREPAPRRVVAAARARAMPARVKQDVRARAARAFGEMPA